MSNKVVFGLKNVHYAVITETGNTITYATPVSLPGAVNLSLETKGEQSDFYADNRVYFSTAANQGYDGTLEIANITDEFRTNVLGEVLQGTDKVLIEKADAQPKKIALLFEIDGDVKSSRFALFYCTVNRPSVSGATKTEALEPGTSELTFVASPRPTDELIKAVTTPETTSGVYDSWFTEVYEESQGGS